MHKNRGAAIGRAAALLLAVETTVFGGSLIWEMLAASEFAKGLGYTASLLIAVSVVIMMACLCDVTKAESGVFGLLALVSATLYAPFCIGVYFLQLAIVAANTHGLSADVLKAITFKPGSPTFALDMLGYGFLCLSTLAAGFALPGRQDKALRALCWLHGALVVPTIASPLLSTMFLSSSGETDHTGSFVLLFWCIVFVPIALLFGRHFQERGKGLSLQID